MATSKIKSERVLLWENPSPNSDFAAQTITIPDFSGYANLEILTRTGLAYTRFPVAEFKTNYVWLNAMDTGAGRASSNGRKVSYVSDTQIQFDVGTYWNPTGNNVLASCAVPLKIWGIR